MLSYDGHLFWWKGRRSLSPRALAALYLLGSLGIPREAVCEVSSIEEIRAPQTMYHSALDADVQLAVRDELSLGNGSCEILLTSHVGNRHSVYPGYLLRLWRVSDHGFELLAERFGHGEVSAEPFFVEGRALLFVQDIAASAGADWIATVIYYIDSDCELRTVEFDPAEACGVELPRLMFEDSGRGSTYDLKDSVVGFSSALWCPGDSPNFPTRGHVEGSLGIRATEKGGLAANVSECRREERFCEP